MLRKIIYIICSVVLWCSCETKPEFAEIVIKVPGNGKTYIQKEGIFKFDSVALNENGEAVLRIDNKETGYYIFVDTKQSYNYIYLTPGSKISLTENETGVDFAGDNKEINEFINQNRYLGHSGETTVPFSAGWCEERDREVNGLIQKLEQSGLPEDFVGSHKHYYRLSDWSQRLSGPGNAAIFRGVTVELDSNYYDFLKTMDFSDERIMNKPGWFKIVLTALEEMEKQGLIEVSLENYFDIYAKRIGNEKMRSHLMYELLNHTLEMGYSDDFPANLGIARKNINDEEVTALLPELEQRYMTLKEKNAPVLRGQKAPEFEAVDVKGKAYKTSDFAGKVMILDFWFTGCLPCKAEMPYFEQMAKDMAGEEVCFLSMSLDTEGTLLDTWKNMVAGKEGPVYYLNVPGGFKAALPAAYLIHGVPRIVIVDKEGNIVDAYAKRPSDPKLKLQLEKLSKN